MRDFLRLLRVHQYSKNAFIILPLFFAGEIMDPAGLLQALKAFASFSLLASAVYILNDCKDAPFDREHPIKKDRPIPSGRISVPKAMGIATALLLAGCVGMFLTHRDAFMVMLLYFTINLLYTFGLKHISILDVTAIAVGFVLRLFVGAEATGVHLSVWMVTMTFLLAFFLALAKRRDDLIIFERTGKQMRRSMDGYNAGFLDISMAIMAAIVIVSYMMYTVSPEVTARIGSQRLYLTGPFVIVGVLRYLQLTFVEERSGSPTQVLLHDRFTQINLVLWLLAFGRILYS